MKDITNKIKYNESMAQHTTFRTGGKAQMYIEPDTEEDLAVAIEYCKHDNIDYFLLGNGSNVLVSDEGFRGAVISLKSLRSMLRIEGDALYASVGYMLKEIAIYAAEHSLSGLEFASGIPGTLGGAIYMNAGAYGREMKDVVYQVRIMENNSDIHMLNAADMDFSYRHSNVSEKHRVVLGASFHLSKDDKTNIYNYMKELNRRRQEKQPLGYPSAGSTFKRPENNFAGKLIDEAGLRGYKIGGAMVSEKHCGFIVNYNNATAGDVYRLITAVSDRVYTYSGIILEPEVRLLGEFK